MKPNKFYHFLFSCLLGGMLLFPAGCSNEEYDDVIDGSNGECIPIDVNFSGIQTLFGPYGEEARNVQYNKIHETRDMDKGHMLETLVMAEPDTLRSPLTRAESALTSTTLRLVAYDNSGAYAGTGVYNIDDSGQVTDSEQLLLTKTGTYTFHCFSPALPVTVSGNTVTVDLPAAGGTTAPAFYYAKTDPVSVTVSQTGNNKTTIMVPTLIPQFCKLTLDVTGTFTEAVVSTTLYTGATMTLPDGTVTSNTPVTSTTISSSNPTIYVYPGSTGSFGITVNKVKINGENMGNLTWPANTIGMTLASGNAYEIIAHYAAKNYIQIDELPFKVAYGQLLYNSTTGKWMLGPDQGYINISNERYETLTTNVGGYGSNGDKVYSYFRWGVQAKNPNYELVSSGPYPDAGPGYTEGIHYGTTFGYDIKAPTSASTDVSNYKNNNDPCYAALGGRWHLPTGGSSTTDIGYYEKPARSPAGGCTYVTRESLSSLNHIRRIKGVYIGTTTQPSVAEQDKYIFMPASGYIDNYRQDGVVKERLQGSNKVESWCSTSHLARNFLGANLEISTYDGSFYYGTYADGGANKYYGIPLRCISY